jgi:D-alanyl-D-alanine carboxypeptidase
MFQRKPLPASEPFTDRTAYSRLLWLWMAVIFYLGTAGQNRAQSFDPILADKLQNTLDSIRAAHTIRGISACIYSPGLGTWKGTSGFSHAGFPISTDMEFGIASNTKLFTGVLLLKLAEHQIIRLDDSLFSYLPTYNNIDPNITIRQLLNHTSGLDDVTHVPGYSDSMLTDPHRIFAPSELVNWAGPALFAPGTGWDYCNTNYLLAGMIAESATGQSYGQLLRDSILAPLQLDSTFLDVFDSVLYTVAHPWQAGVDHFSTPRTSVNSAAWAAGAMYSTSSEMVQWYRALMNGQVLRPSSFTEMTTFVGTGQYGIGIAESTVSGRTVWLHGGAIWGGYNSSMMYDIATGTVICVLINEFPSQAYLVSSQLLSTLLNPPVGIPELGSGAQNCPLYPNPTTGTVRIDIPHTNLRNIRIYHPTGPMVLETTDAQLDLTPLSPGIYYLNLQTDQGTFLYKILKQ